MRIENLKVGMVLKNYKHLCSLLCIEPKGKAGSNSRIAQIKEINRSVKYKKLEGGNKLVILEVYNELKDKEDFRTKGNNSKYVENIEKIVLYTLNKHNSNEALILSRGRLLEVCNMINENYRIGKQNISKISALTEFKNISLLIHSKTSPSKINRSSFLGLFLSSKISFILSTS